MIEGISAKNRHIYIPNMLFHAQFVLDETNTKKGMEINMQRKSLKVLFGIIKKKFMLYIGVIFCIVLSTVVSSVITAETLRRLISSAYLGEKLFYSLAIFVIVVLIGIFLNAVKAVLNFNFSKYAHVTFEDEIISCYGNAKYWGIGMKMNDAHDRIKRNSSQVVDSFFSFSNSCIAKIVTLVSSTIYVIYLNPTIFLLCVCIDVVMIFLSRKKIFNLSHLQKELNEANKDVYASSWEQINNMEVARYLNLERVMSGYSDSVDNYSNKLLAWKKCGNWLALFSQFGGIIMVLIVILVGSVLTLRGNITFDKVFALATVVPGLSQTLFSVPNLLGDYKKLRTNMTRVDDVLNMEQDEGKGEKIDKKICSLEVAELSFAYSVDKPVLNSISFKAVSGVFTCITGLSGCGKSTLVKLCAKLLPYETGSICWNHSELNLINRRMLWERVGYIGQIPQILSGSILFNITLGKEAEDGKSRVVQALKDADLTQLVESLPDGVDTIIDKGKLSNGEQQKLCFARAFYHNQDVWLLDEATAALDPEAELTILSNMRKNIKSNHNMVIMVSHRKQALELADQIIFMKNGQVESCGTYNALVSDGSLSDLFMDV